LALPVWNTAVSTLFLKEDLEIIDIHLFWKVSCFSSKLMNTPPLTAVRDFHITKPTFQFATWSSICHGKVNQLKMDGCVTYQHTSSSWPVPVTRIKTLPSIFLYVIPGIFCPSFYIDRATSKFVLQEVLSNVSAIYADGNFIVFFSNIHFRIRYPVPCIL
jgi:hypothetical protein